VEHQQDIQGRLFARDSTLFRGPPLYQPRTPWGAASALLVALIIVLLSGGIAAGLLIWLGGAAELPAGGGGAEAAIGINMFAIWQAAVVLLTLVAATRGGIANVLALNHVPSGWRAFAGAIGALAVMQVGLGLVQYVVIRHDMLTDLRLFYEMIRGPQWLVTAAVIGIGAPLSEEFLFRGFLQSALARTRIGFWWAALIATVLWTTLHAGYSAVGLVEVFLIGLFFSWLLWRTGSLWVPILCHAVYNSLIVLVLRFVDLPAPT
jgi:uncharacterized protein